MALNSIALSPDQSRLYAAGAALEEYDWKTGDRVREFPGHSSHLTSVEVSRLGMIAAAGADAKIRVRSRDGCLMGVLEGHRDVVSSLAFNWDGSLLASGGWDGEAKVWDMKCMCCICTFRGHSDWVNAVQFSGRDTVISAGIDTMWRWSARTGEVIAHYGMERGAQSACRQYQTRFENRLGHSPSVLDIEARGETLAAACSDGLRFWSVANGGEPTRLVHIGPVAFFCLSLSPDGRMVALGSATDSVLVHDIEAERTVARLVGHRDWPVCLRWTGERTLVSAGIDCAIIEWEVRPSSWLGVREKRRYRGGLRPVHAMSVHGDKLAVAGQGDAVSVYSLKTGKLEFRNSSVHDNWVYGAEFSPKGDRIVTAGRDGRAAVYSVDCGSSISVEHYPYEVAHIDFSPSGEKFAVGFRNGRVHLHYASTGTAISRLEVCRSNVRAIRFVSEHKLLAGTWDERIYLISLETGTTSRTYDHGSWVNALVLIEGEKGFISAGHDGAIRAFDLATGQKTLEFDAHQGRITSLVMSDDGELLVSGGHDRKVKVWRWRERKLIHTFGHHCDAVKALAITGDRRLFIGSRDGTVSVCSCADEYRVLATLYDTATDGWLWTTEDGWLFTNHEDLIEVYESRGVADGSELLPSDDPTRKTFLLARNDAKKVIAKIGRLDAADSSTDRSRRLIELFRWRNREQATKLLLAPGATNDRR